MDRYCFPEHERSLLEALRVPIAVFQFVGNGITTLVVSGGFCELLGIRDRGQVYAAMDSDIYGSVHPDDVVRVNGAVYRFVRDGGGFESIYRLRKPDGSYRLVHAYGRHIFTDTGVRLAQVWYADEGDCAEGEGQGGSTLSQSMRDALHRESVLHASNYDSMTGLPGMTYFFELAEAGKEAIRQAGDQPVFLFFDLNGMKFFNQKNGFSEGDRQLKAFAKHLSGTFGNERCCHISGDHFAVYTEETGVEAVLKGFFAAWHGADDGANLPVRVGIYANRMEDVPVSVACDRAKFACDSIRNIFTSGFTRYNKALRDDLEKRRYVLTNIDRAIENRWIKVYFQPIVRAVNGRVCDEEALARWIDPERGFLSPAEFIPYLEDAGQIYKLDLFVLERVLEKIQSLKKAGLHIVPQSVNLSRSDFDACDIVEEIRRRVDAAGVSRETITIEITESTIGGNFNFIKGQIERFQNLGFPVWMDDFGSGYSSLDVLQSVKFDLIKFDMSFMKRLDEGEAGKIILTELMKMATALGVDTVCEGVETEAQVRFLQAIGCSKLQGYYFLKPIPLEELLRRYETGVQIGFENPEESAYYDSMGRINLYDLSFLASKDENVLRNTFDTLPMAVMEIDPEGGSIQYVRSNESYRDFMKKTFGHDLSGAAADRAIPIPENSPWATFMKNVDQGRGSGERTFIEEKLRNGPTVHSFVRHIGVNPITGKSAAAIAVLSITEPDEGTTYASIARALAADYYNLFYVSLSTGDYIEYSSPVGGEEIAEERHGKNFFESARADTLTRIYEEDQERFLSRFTKENIVRELDEHGVFTTTYRLVAAGAPVYARMKVMRMGSDPDHIILGIRIIDAEMKRRNEWEAQKEGQNG